MDELVPLLAATAGIGSVAASKIAIVVSKIVVIDGKAPNLSHVA